MKKMTHQRILASGFLFLGIILLVVYSCTNAGSGNDNEGQEKKDLPGHMIQPVSYLNIEIKDNFWRPKIEKNWKAGIRSDFKEASDEIDNFDIASGKKKGKRKGGSASDTNIYKIIQGVAYSLHSYPDPELENFVDSLIDRIVAAQQPDGYLNTYTLINDPGQEWKNLEEV